LTKLTISVPDLLIIAGLAVIAWGLHGIYPPALKVFIGILLIAAAVIIKPVKVPAETSAK
jgi:hypothetical protein